MAALAQHLTNALAHPRPWRRRASWLARRAHLVVTDPVVTVELAGMSLRLPLSHHLPAILGELPDYASNVGRAARIVTRGRGNATLIDVGANVGDTVAIMRAAVPDAAVLAIEGAAEHVRFLEANVAGLDDVEIAQAYLGDRRETLSASEDLARGSGQLVPRAEGPPVALTTLDRLLEAHARFGSAPFLKVDTDGFDARVLRGAPAFLERTRPAVFFELHPHLLAESDPGGTAILSYLHELGYRDALFYTERGDLFAELRAGDRERVKELIDFASRNARRYWDICAFHADDAELAAELAAAERETR